MQFKNNIIFILFTIYYNHCNFAKPLLGVNVRPDIQNEFLYVVSIMKISGIIQNKEELNHKCTGTLISKQDILTAAHCVTNAMRYAIKVMIGSVDLACSVGYYPIFFTTFDHWALRKRIRRLHTNNDIAIIKIIGIVPDYIPFALIANASITSLYGLDVVTAGWGKLENNTIPRIMHTVQLRVISNDECERKISMHTSEWVSIEEIRLCTIGYPYALLSNGDSGGPLLYNGFIIGVNIGICPSSGNVANHEQVNVHMNIQAYCFFLADIVNNFNMIY